MTMHYAFSLVVLISTSSAIPSFQLDGVVHGWNTTIGSAKDRSAAEEFFDVRVVDNDVLWLNNVMTPFKGKTLRMTDIQIEERNAFNTVIEVSVKTGTVLWTIEEGSAHALGAWVEHINGAYTGVAHIAGFASRNSWIENDSKSLLGLKVANDWGVVTVLTSTDTTVVMKYWSYKKGKFTMTWTLETNVLV